MYKKHKDEIHPIIICQDSAEAKCRISDPKVAGSNPGSDVIFSDKAVIFNDHNF